MTTIPNVSPHSLDSFGKTEPITPEEANLLGVDLCDVYQRLKPRSREDHDTTIKVVYVVGTSNKAKLENMDKDMRQKLAQVSLNIPGAEVKFLGTYGLEVPSGQPDQPVGPVQGLGGAAAKEGRIGYSFLGVEKLLRNEEQDLEIPEGLEDAVKNADVHIFGGQEASPDMKAEPAYDSNYIAYYFATMSPVEQNQRYRMAKTLGLEVIPEAVIEAVRRNNVKHEGRKNWTGGKVLAECYPNLITDPQDWHQVLSREKQGRFFYSDLGYQDTAMQIPLEWFEHVNPGSAAASASQ